jgi:hypothetical protein
MSDVEIREQLHRYLSREISLSDFKRWFVPATWNIDRDEDLCTRELAADIDLRLAEFSQGHWTEEELRDLFTSILETQSFEITINTRLPLRLFYSALARPSQLVFSGKLS